MKSNVLTIACGVAVALAAARYASASPADNHQIAQSLVTKFVDAQNTQNVALFDDIFPTNYIQHNPEVAPGLVGVKKAFAEEFTAIKTRKIPFHVSVEDVLVDGDHVVLRSITKLEQHGKWFQVRSIDEWRIANGKLAEHWDTDEKPRPAQR